MQDGCAEQFLIIYFFFQRNTPADPFPTFVLTDRLKSFFHFLFFAQGFTFQHRVSYFADHQFDGADCVVIGRDQVVDIGWVAVGVNHRYDRHALEIGFMDRRIFPADIHNKDQVGKAIHVTDTAEVDEKPVNLAFDRQLFFLHQPFDLTGIAHFFEALQLHDPRMDRGPVGQRSRQPSFNHIRHAAAFSFDQDGFLRLALGTD